MVAREIEDAPAETSCREVSLARDRAIYQTAVIDLSPSSRYLRFFAPIPRLSERLLDQMTQTDGHRF